MRRDDLHHVTLYVNMAKMRSMWCCPAVQCWPIMRKTNSLALLGATAATVTPPGSPPGAAAASTDADRLEMLEWSDPERAAQILDAAPPLAASSVGAGIEVVEMRGMILCERPPDGE